MGVLLMSHTICGLVLDGVIIWLYRYHPQAHLLTLVSSEYHFTTVFYRSINLGEFDTAFGIV